MKYMLLIYGNEELWESFRRGGRSPRSSATRTPSTQSCARPASSSAPTAWPTRSRPRPSGWQDGVPAVTDGPYIEAKEYLGSFDIVDCDSLERALEIAARVPFARLGSVEVRPLMHEAAPEV